MRSTQVDVGVRSDRSQLGLVRLGADVMRPDGALGAVVFAHGSGSSRLSPRNQAVARSLNECRLATLLIDLLSAEEEREDARTGELRFAVPMLAARLVAAMDWLGGQPEGAGLPVGLFGASTGAAAALIAATERPARVRAVVSRGGRPDLAGRWLPNVHAPTLLIVGERDTEVLDLNSAAMENLIGTQSELVVVPDATHLFEEPGALDRVAELSCQWFTRHLTSAPRPAG